MNYVDFLRVISNIYVLCSVDVAVVYDDETIKQQ